MTVSLFIQRIAKAARRCRFVLLLWPALFTTKLQAQKRPASFSVIPLGVKGGLDESNLSAYLVSAGNRADYISLDAGTLYSGAKKVIGNGLYKGTPSSFLRQRVKGYLISHPHLDHVAGLIINAPDDTSKNIYGLPFTLKTLQEKYFSWDSWANFGDAGKPPLLKKYHYVPLTERNETALENTGLSVTAVALSHSAPGQSTAFLLRNGEAYLLYLGDTGPDSVEQNGRLSELWQMVAPLVGNGALKAIFIEVSFLNEQPDKQLFGHLTPSWLMKEMAELNQLSGHGSLAAVPLIITHSKQFGKKEIALRAQLAKANTLHLSFVFPRQGCLYRF